MDFKNPGSNVLPGNSNLLDYANNLNVYQLLILLTTIVVIILSTAFFLWRKVKVTRNAVLLMGLCDAGKTLIFSRLLHGIFVKTLTSTKENIGDLAVRTRSIKLVDIPGHERLRYRFFEEFKNQARGIIFVIDSVTFSKDICDVAEFLFTILSDGVLQTNKVPIIVACNKQDETMTKSSKVIEAALAKEINVLRITKSNQLEATTDQTNITKAAFLGKADKDFTFDHLPFLVEFGETSAMKNDKTADLEVIEDWLVQVA